MLCNVERERGHVSICVFCFSLFVAVKVMHSRLREHVRLSLHVVQSGERT